MTIVEVERLDPEDIAGPLPSARLRVPFWTVGRKLAAGACALGVFVITIAVVANIPRDRY